MQAVSTLENIFSFSFQAMAQKVVNSSTRSVASGWTLTSEQIALIALGVFAGIMMFAVAVGLQTWLILKVSVVQDGSEPRMAMLNTVNGVAKVTYTSFLSSRAILEGNFLNGNLLSGNITYPLGSVAKEEGQFQDGWLTQGKTVYRSGKTAEGKFRFGKLLEGKTTFPDGRIFETRASA